MRGSSIGHYQITGRIGGGGMGEVWRAHDSELNRDVAVKVLPKEFAENADRLGRFQQEARSLAALNHPNLLMVHDAGIHGGQPYLVSELLEGKTLRELLEIGPLSERKMVDYALQLAHGLAAAHAKGIIHRDLKPENIFVTHEGRLKILDFGLAKLRPALAGAGPGSVPEAATLIERTQPGVVLGTASYMSPEQVRGEPVDPRSDLFAFGLVLYEMLSGQRAFRKASAAETMAAILNEEPPSLPSLAGNPPVGVIRIAERCLEKAPEHRFQTAADLAFALESLSHSSASHLGVMPGEVGRKTNRWPKLAWIAAFLAAMLLAGFWLRPARSDPAHYQQITSRPGTVLHARFGTDGQSMVCSAQWGNEPITIFSTSERGLFTQVPVVTNADLLAVSKAGDLAVLVGPKRHAWLLQSGTLARMKPGEAARPLLENVLEADWFPDGENLLVVRKLAGGYRLEEYPSGHVLHQSSGYLSYPRVSPQGDRVAFLAHTGSGDNRGWAVIMNRSGQTNAVCGEWIAVEGLVWEPAGREVWFGVGPTDMQTWELRALSVRGQVRRLTGLPGIGVPSDIDRSGRLLLNRVRTEWEVVSGRIPEGSETPIYPVGDGPVGELSPDGRHYLLCYQGYKAGSSYTAYLGNIDGSPAVQLGAGYPVALSPDGRWVIAIRASPRDYVLLPTGLGQVRTLDLPGIDPVHAGWLGNSRILVTGRGADHQLRFHVKDLRSEAIQTLNLAGVRPQRSSIPVSPSGDKFVAVDTNHVLLVCSLDETPPQPIPGTAANDLVIGWCADNNSVFIVRAQSRPTLRVERVHTGSGPTDPTPVLILQSRRGEGAATDRWVSLTPDGKTYLATTLKVLSDLFLVDGLR